MKRREFLRVIGLGSAALVLPGCTGATRSSETLHKKRPNFLFVMSDDHATNAIGCYSSRINKTPNIDRLAKEGMRFDNCFCTNSICVPSRASILTGKYGHKNGCITLDEPFDGRQQTFPKLLQKTGYYTGVIGKWHLFTKPTAFDYYNVLPEQGLYFDPLFKEKGKPWRDGEEGGRVIEGYVTDITADLVLDFLQNRPKDRPFCLLYHNKAPHDLWEYDDKHAHLYEETDIPEPDNLFDDYRNRGRAIRQNTFKIGMEDTIYEEQTGHLRGKRRKQKQYQIFIKSYLRCVASIDDNFGRVLDYLGRWGLADNTIVVYTSDQGFFLGEHGLWDKRMMYEESIRMPLIIRYPKVIKPGSIRDEIGLNIDAGVKSIY
ncbi:MAG: sulfatase-like hydrolase/transferase, partial [Planctomycetes bacterium]|nr:sulfatase-like hydrolase/transferase [Planctomycetota bacterium]